MGDYTEHLISLAGGDGEPAVSEDFITANRAEGGATIRQITGSKLSAEIHLDPAQVTFVLDQLSPRTDDAERYNQRDGEPDLDQIQARADAATEGPWRAGRGATSDGKQFVRTYEQKAAFLALSLNEGESDLWLVDNDAVIPAATGDGPKAKANAEFIAHARTDVPALLALVREQQAVIERGLMLARNLDRLAPGDKHYAGLIRAALTATEGAE